MSGSSNSSTRSKLSASLRELFGVAKKFVGHEKDIDSLDQILDYKRDLERKLNLKEEEIVSLRSDKDREIGSLRIDKEREIETLRSTKDEEIATLRSTKDTLFKEFQEKYKTWDTGTTKQKELRDEIDELKVKLTQANERADSSEGRSVALQQQLWELQNVGVELENKLKVVRGLLSSKERELTGTVRALEDCQNKLDEERGELGLEYLDREDLLVDSYLM
jgi:chromosome segregation ATPase